MPVIGRGERVIGWATLRRCVIWGFPVQIGLDNFQEVRL